MIRIKDTTCSHTGDLLDRAIGVAEYYGFIPVEDAPRHPLREAVSGRNPRFKTGDIQFTRRDERALLPVIRTCATRGLGDTRKPVFLWKVGAASKNASPRYTTLDLHIVGVPHTAAEAILIAISNAIADEIGITNRVVSVNSIGSTDSSARFAREVGMFLRKHIDDLNPSLRSRAVDDPIGVLIHLIERGNPIIVRAPQSMEFLNEEERRHFWSVLEYLESAGTYYELKPHLLGSRDCWTHTLFEICHIDQENKEILPFARGGRYDSLAALGVGAGACAVGLSISFETQGKTTVKRRVVQKQEPNIFFVHLGTEAKRRSIPVLETLRKADIPVHQSLVYDRLSDQMDKAKKLNPAHLLIMGHKEAVEGTIMVRNMATNSQDSIPIERLTGYLRQRRIV